MAHQHSPRFLKIVEDTRKRIREVTIDEVKAKLDRKEKFLLIDVREESEYAADHLPGAVHLGKGIIERDVEARVPDQNTPMVLYCGGGFRSALAADNLQKMGYTNVESMDGGWKGWLAAGLPISPVWPTWKALPRSSKPSLAFNVSTIGAASRWPAPGRRRGRPWHPGRRAA